MDTAALRANLNRVGKICKTKADALKYLLLIYGTNPGVNWITKGKLYRINFCFSDMEPLRLALRNNRGSDSYIFSEVFLRRYYDFKLPGSPSYILDLGANIGLTTIYFSRMYPEARLAAVEPMPNNVEFLRWNLQANNVRSEVIPAAVAVEDGEVKMIVADRDYNHRITEGDDDRTIVVNAFSVPGLMTKLGWPRIDLLKIDIEGYESKLLRQNTEWLHSVNNLLLELHDDKDIAQLNYLANHYHFKAPREINGLWYLSR